jgi:hypothetical protein
LQYTSNRLIGLFSWLAHQFSMDFRANSLQLIDSY